MLGVNDISLVLSRLRFPLPRFALFRRTYRSVLASPVLPTLCSPSVLSLLQNLVEWETKSLALLEKARRQKEEGERLLDEARDRLPKVSQSFKTVRMYLEYLKLARRQIKLEREFGLGALRTRPPAEGGGGRGAHDRADGGGGVHPLPSGCGIEVRGVSVGMSSNDYSTIVVYQHALARTEQNAAR